MSHCSLPYCVPFLKLNSLLWIQFVYDLFCVICFIEQKWNQEAITTTKTLAFKFITLHTMSFHHIQHANSFKSSTKSFLIRWGNLSIGRSGMMKYYAFILPFQLHFLSMARVLFSTLGKVIHKKWPLLANKGFTYLSLHCSAIKNLKALNLISVES